MTEPSTTGLENVPLFAGLTPAALELLLDLGQEFVYDPGTTIFEHQAEGQTLFVLLEGRVRIAREVPGRSEELMLILERGAVFGEMALVDGAAGSGTARAQDHCRVIGFERTAFDDLLLMRQDLAIEILWNLVRILCGRLRDTNDRLCLLAASTGT